MASRTAIVFLDIDGVMNDHSSDVIDPARVKWLNYFISRCSMDVEIVFNTAWNTNSLDFMVDAFKTAGFKYPSSLIGQTDSSGGGGGPIRRWLTANDRVGACYIAIDDSTRNYGEMWGRLIHCRSDKGFGKDEAKQATDTVWRGWRRFDDRIERNAAVSNLVKEAQRLAFDCPWLTAEQREQYIRGVLDIVRYCLTVPDFLTVAYLKEIPDELQT